ncbi:alpha/beta fold hydrolase [Variovorax sp. MHTC-1]|uniref:alpha/beta fold hydrolase n=1 Tax=Variovorax sp. MHTC-1 TaxID=2495593 RepID=UPI000F889B41|nr:alpha/beta hydrolase [Variovorax sp. MHTC-1]RST55607.1 alpha/beta hydrolase [Variovorax sp. MHTC-1]
MNENALGSLRRVQAGVLKVAFHESGPADGPPVLLLHGFPYDVQSYVEVAPQLAAEGCRVVVPYLRGFGPTQFTDAGTPRSGEQAAIGADVRDLLDALAIPRAVLAGYDWGGTAACVAAALWPERCTGLISVNSYKIHNIAAAKQPIAPENEARYWYQYYFHAERGRTGLTQNRRALCKLLWRMWSPIWQFDDATYERSAAAFDNPDFVDIVIHSYRHRHGLVPGDPAYAAFQARLAEQPDISVPSITFDGTDDGVMPVGGTADHGHHFIGRHEHRVVQGAGHNLPQEKPQAFVDAVRDLVHGNIGG